MEKGQKVYGLFLAAAAAGRRYVVETGTIEQTGETITKVQYNKFGMIYNNADFNKKIFTDKKRAEEALYKAEDPEINLEWTGGRQK